MKYLSKPNVELSIILRSSDRHTWTIARVVFNHKLSWTSLLTMAGPYFNWLLMPMPMMDSVLTGFIFVIPTRL